RLRSLINHNLSFSLAQSVEAAKCCLSTQMQATITFTEEDIQLSEAISRMEFEDLIQGEIEKIRTCLDGLLSDSDLTASDINTVFLTGGTSYVPIMKQLFEEEIGATKVVQGDAFISVTSGLALSAKLFFH
ncbi:MAG: Hsp70 family protein, partial [Atribacterota bacterium]|nr:Hsp70 family protein [Atribacterota bacterium]